jgi:queuine/archaeosine tRNA-ribosyltransferase
MEESNDRVWNQKHKEQIKGERFKSKSERPQDGFSCPAARFLCLAIRRYPTTLNHIFRQLIEIKSNAIFNHPISIKQLVKFRNIIKEQRINKVYPVILKPSCLSDQ